MIAFIILKHLINAKYTCRSHIVSIIINSTKIMYDEERKNYIGYFHSYNASNKMHTFSFY